MRTLTRAWLAWIGFMAVLCATIQYIVLLVIAPKWSPTNNPAVDAIITWALSGTIIYSLVFTFGLRLFRTVLWRLFFPRLDFSGVWHYRIHLEAPKGSDGMSPYRDNSAEQQLATQYIEERHRGGCHGRVLIEQTPFSFKVFCGEDVDGRVSSKSPSKVSWESIATELSDDGYKVIILFRQRLNQEWFRGVDELDVQAAGTTRIRRPRYMKGAYPVWHSGGDHLLLKGYIEYFREGSQPQP
jgi:hypothetical protein